MPYQSNNLAQFSTKLSAFLSFRSCGSGFGLGFSKKGAENERIRVEILQKGAENEQIRVEIDWIRAEIDRIRVWIDWIRVEILLKKAEN